LFMDNPLFLIPLLVGGVFLFIGFLFYQFPPKKINGLYGYRTPASMESQERWDFAQKYSSVEMMKSGLLLLLLCLPGLIFFPPREAAVFIGLGLMLLVVIIMIVRVERAIKRKFGAVK